MNRKIESFWRHKAILDIGSIIKLAMDGKALPVWFGSEEQAWGWAALKCYELHRAFQRLARRRKHEQV